MGVDAEKLRNLIDTLSDDQKNLLREGLTNGENFHPDNLADVFTSIENREIFGELIQASVADGGTDGGTTLPPDGGTDGGAPPPPPRPEPPLTRW